MINIINQLQAQFTRLCQQQKLFRSSVSGAEIWDLYLAGFENDPIFRDPNSTSPQL
jgi:hypothetical protein